MEIRLRQGTQQTTRKQSLATDRKWPTPEVH